MPGLATDPRISMVTPASVTDFTETHDHYDDGGHVCTMSVSCLSKIPSKGFISG